MAGGVLWRLIIMLGAVVWTGQFLEQVRGLGPITTFIQIGAGAMVYFGASGNA